MLSKEQIESLFYFCTSNGVLYYDVQVELVDHLANAVELEMQNDSKLSFEKALEKVHQSFGVMGFAPLVSEKQKQAEMQSRKLFWRLLKAQFGWPKILIFFLLLSVLTTIFFSIPSSINWIAIGIVFICWPISLIGMFRFQAEVARTNKKFLAINFSWIGSLLFLPVYFINFSNFFKVFRLENIFNHLSGNIAIFALSIFLSIYIMAAITIEQTLISVKKNLRKTYPEIFYPSS